MPYVGLFKMISTYSYLTQCEYGYPNQLIILNVKKASKGFIGGHLTSKNTFQ
jgi:hypothetical protein